MQTPKVSVIVPVYNARDYIKEAYESVRAQTFENWELIFIDDGSADQTVAALKEIQDADGRVVIIRHEENKGPAAARNTGIAVARGDWIAILDADDRFLPTRLDVLVREAEQRQVDVIADNIILYDVGADRNVRAGIQSQEPQPLTFEVLYDNDRPGRGFYFGWLKPMFRRNFLERANLRYPENIRYAEDFHFYSECLLEGAKAIVLPIPLYRYSLRIGEISRKVSTLSRTRMDKARHDMAESMRMLRLRYGSQLTPEMDARIGRRLIERVEYEQYEEFKDQLARTRFDRAFMIALRRPAIIQFMAFFVQRRLRNTFSR